MCWGISYLSSTCSPPTSVNTLWHYNMLLFIVQSIIAYTLYQAFWPILRRLVIKTDLDNVPGPASHSLLKGALLWPLSLLLDGWYTRTGNFSKIYNIDAWDFHDEIAQKCRPFIFYFHICEYLFLPRPDGRVARINVVLGVWTYSLSGYYTTHVLLRISSSMSSIRRPCIT